MPDLECTWFPDVWLGISLTPCCASHDVSALDLQSSIDLGACVFGRLADTHPVAGAILGGVMMIGTALWCGLKYGPRGKSRR